MNPDIQELKRLAEAAIQMKGYGPSEAFFNACAARPDTILALIEAVEAAQKLAAIDDIPEHGCDDDLSLNCAETGAPISFMSSEDFRRLRTALEGVKK